MHPLMCFPLKLMDFICLKHYLILNCAFECFVSGFPLLKRLDLLSGLPGALIDLPVVSRPVSQYFFGDDRILHVILQHLLGFGKGCVLLHQ